VDLLELLIRMSSAVLQEIQSNLKTPPPFKDWPGILLARGLLETRRQGCRRSQVKNLLVVLFHHFPETNRHPAGYSNRTIMKTISIQSGTMDNPQGLLTAAGVWGLRPHRAPAEWLPARPAAPRQQDGVKLKRSATQTRLWISLPAEPTLEKGLLSLLALAGVIGIGYGFSCLVDLVQNWALVNASIGRMIN